MAMNFYRADGWVKLVSGVAVPGAQVYILSQPANVTAPITPPRTLPIPFTPNPQVQVYSDAGFTPVAQPVITDGFGHYDFYALPGLYTIAIFFGGKLSQFYIDQTVGNIGSAGAATVLLETNGSPNFNQSILNLIQGANVTLTPDNFGNVVIASTGGGGSSLTLETNGVVNGSQALLNLVNGSGINITQDGAGNVTVTNAGSVTNAASWFWSTDTFITPNGQSSDARMVDIISAGGPCAAVMVQLSTTIVVHKITLQVTIASATTKGVVAIYNATGTTKLIDAGTNAFDTSALGVQTVSITPVTLSAGNYLVAWSNTGGNGAVRVAGLDGNTAGLSDVPLLALTANANRYVRATNGITAGAMPASLGALSVPSSGQRFDVPAFLFE